MNVTSATYNSFARVNATGFPAGIGTAHPQPAAQLRDAAEQSDAVNKIQGNQTQTDQIRGTPHPTAPRQGDQTQQNQGTSSDTFSQGEIQGNSQTNQSGSATLEQLTPEELRIVEQLKQIDSEVRTHEMAHVAAGGAHITSGASFTFKRGPDGQNYAVAGEVRIDTSPVPGDPEATMRKMEQIRRAALAPADPSAQDLKVAANASAESLKALSDLNLLRAEQMAEKREAFGPSGQQAADSYARVDTLPETSASTFELAV